MMRYKMPLVQQGMSRHTLLFKMLPVPQVEQSPVQGIGSYLSLATSAP